MVDATAGHKMLTFLDAWSGYNLIKMHPNDQENTAFRSERGSTYQRLLNMMFKQQIGQTMEKISNEAESDKVYLWSIQSIISGVHGDLEGDRGQHRTNLSNSAALKRFISRSSDRCRLFYDVLRKRQRLEWTEDHEKAFQELKRYLSTPPLLSKPQPGEPLFLYLSVIEAKTRYTSLEKLVLALVTASYKLRPYFESHTISEITNYPLKTIMRKPKLSGRMAKWSVHLSGYDLKFELRTAINSQALADFVSDFCPAFQTHAEQDILSLEEDKGEQVWELHVDGASNARGAGVGLVLKSPQGDLIVQAVRCEFKATNNEAEYEALILKVCSDSKLIVNHVNDCYEARDPRMMAYLDVAKELTLRFDTFNIKQIPGTRTQKQTR
ncbi:uncharacterized protein LOC141600847 [Silene latifolia]|uniref:uncharacterized protein LOC141600847 n=1 Tax=Silene latifolia TaxID=37657 RepID=UPI003D76B790